MRFSGRPLLWWTLVGSAVSLPGLLDDIETWEKWLSMEGWESWRYFSVFGGAMIIILAWRSTVERWLAGMPVLNEVLGLQADDGQTKEKLREKITQRDLEIARLQGVISAHQSSTDVSDTVEVPADVPLISSQRTPKQLVGLVNDEMMDIEVDRVTKRFLGTEMLVRASVRDVVDYYDSYKVTAQSEDGVRLRMEFSKGKDLEPLAEVEGLVKQETILVRGRVRSIIPQCLFLEQCKIE